MAYAQFAAALYALAACHGRVNKLKCNGANNDVVVDVVIVSQLSSGRLGHVYSSCHHAQLPLPLTLNLAPAPLQFASQLAVGRGSRKLLVAQHLDVAGMSGLIWHALASSDSILAWMHSLCLTFRLVSLN